MFGFGKKGNTSPDEHLTMMTVDEANDFRDLVGREFARAGQPVQLLPDHALTPEGRQFGLWNVAAMCAHADRGRKEWSTIVRHHLHTLLNPPPDPSTLSDDELLQRVHSRLFEAASLPDNDALSYGRALAHGVVELVAVDYEETLGTLTGAEMETRGAERVWAAARARTSQVPIDERAAMDVDGVEVTVVAGGSFYLASRAIDMTGLLAEVFGERSYPHGVVVGFPHRHMLVLHPIDDARSLQAVGQAAQITAMAFAGAAGAISPILHWWNGGDFQAVSRIGDDEVVGIVADGPFLEALNSLAE